MCRLTDTLAHIGRGMVMGVKLAAAAIALALAVGIVYASVELITHLIAIYLGANP